ncbi:unnamed protein product [Larinioides sclopetarius]|uniref:Uncharacterized protein n=1 Tax=Larinioides sclopetarius TaxID=280406 RepID=A0AAV2BDC9_9ARAC
MIHHQMKNLNYLRWKFFFLLLAQKPRLKEIRRKIIYACYQYKSRKFLLQLPLNNVFFSLRKKK